MIFWKLTSKISEKIYLNLLKKESSGNLDLDNLVRFILLVFLMFLFWSPILYLLTMIFDK